MSSENVQTPQQGIRLVDVPVSNENQALNLLVSFLGLAQRRGAFGLDEAAKIFDCVRMFQKTQLPAENTILQTTDGGVAATVEAAVEATVEATAAAKDALVQANLAEAAAAAEASD